MGPTSDFIALVTHSFQMMPVALSGSELQDSDLASLPTGDLEGSGGASIDSVTLRAGDDARPLDLAVTRDRRKRPKSAVAGVVMSTLAVIVGLWWGRSFMVPLTVGLMLAMLMAPVTGRLTRWLRLRVLAAALTMTLVVGALGLAAMAFGGQLARVAGRAPDMISLVAQQLSDTEPNPDSLLARSRQAFRELDRAADRFAGLKPLILPTTGRAARTVSNAVAGAAAASVDSTQPQVSISQSAGVALRESAVSGSGALLKLASDITLISFIAFFLLAGGEPLSAHFLDLFGADADLRLRAHRAAVECVRQIRIYGAVLLVTNTFVGVTVWLAFEYAGLPDAAGWGVTAAVLHVVPYLGMALLTVLSALEAFLAHGTITAAVGVAAFVILLSTVIGTVVTAWLQGRAAKMNPAAVFIGVVFWGALWGVWGLLLGPALIVLAKVIAEHTMAGRPLARLMQG